MWVKGINHSRYQHHLQRCNHLKRPKTLQLRPKSCYGDIVNRTEGPKCQCWAILKSQGCQCTSGISHRPKMQMPSDTIRVRDSSCTAWVANSTRLRRWGIRSPFWASLNVLMSQKLLANKYWKPLLLITKEKSSRVMWLLLHQLYLTITIPKQIWRKVANKSTQGKVMRQLLWVDTNSNIARIWVLKRWWRRNYHNILLLLPKASLISIWLTVIMKPLMAVPD